MNTIKQLFVAMFLLAITLTVSAEEKTVTLKVEGMTCASCLYQVEKALANVEGVTQADVVAKTNEAFVTYDDAQTNIAALTEATGNAGFPSILKITN